jgi:hypothetical protein
MGATLVMEVGRSVNRVRRAVFAGLIRQMFY